MKIRRPPATATWLLKLVCSGAQHESLIGDLLEQYQRGRGRLWYWRQVIAIVFLRLYGQLRRLLVSASGISIAQGFALTLLITTLSVVLLTDIWMLFLIGILGGVIAGILIFVIGNRLTEPLNPDRIRTNGVNDVSYHPGIAIHHIPVKGGAGLLFVFATGFIFGSSIAAVREMLVITGPLGIVATAILFYWHKRHPIRIQALNLHEQKHRR